MPFVVYTPKGRQMIKKPKPNPEPGIPQFDNVLKRMLSTPAAPHAKKKPAPEPAEKKKPA
jgi:hypothetical protein